MTHPAEFHIIGKSTKNWSTKLNRIDLAVRDGIKRAFTERETTCKQTNLDERKRKQHNLRNLRQTINMSGSQSVKEYMQPNETYPEQKRQGKEQRPWLDTAERIMKTKATKTKTRKHYIMK